MATKLKLGTDNNWATKVDKLLAYNDENGNFKPIQFDADRDSTSTRVNKSGLIENVEANRPRVEFDGNDGYLLLEPSRTNNLLRSEEFNTSSWTKFSAGTGSNPVVTANYTAAPDGTQTADRVIFDKGSGTTSSDLSQMRQIVSDVGQGVSSVYIKSNTSDSYIMGIDPVGNVSTITVTPEWQRFTYSETTNDRLAIGLRGSQTSSYADVSVWGAQMEAGDYPTSYIPTTSAAVTRTADSCTKVSFADMPTDYPVTIYWSGEVVNHAFGQSAFALIKNGSAIQYLGLDFSSTTLLGLYRRNVNNDADLITYSTSVGSRYKIAVKFISNTTAKVFVNGSLVYNLTSGLDVDWDFDTVLIGQYRVVADVGERNPCDEFMLFNEALSDSELIALTS